MTEREAAWHNRCAVLLIQAEADLRAAGRRLELLVDEEHPRLARVCFRLASRLRSDRLEHAA